MEKWRLIIDEGDVYWNMAVDEAMLILREKNIIPNTLRLYVFKPSSVTIGRFQKLREAVNLEYLLENKISFTRRITGGGSVYHDEGGEITYSIVASIDSISRDIIESYRRICMGIIYAIKSFGLNPVFKPINDIVVNNKKISGSAQSRKKNALLQHGTLMYNTNLDILEKTLKAPKEKLVSHGVSRIRDRVTTLSIELGYIVSKREVVDALITGFSKALNIEFYRDHYSEEEEKLASKLVKKYSSREWIYSR